jgi:hypothetical protein
MAYQTKEECEVCAVLAKRREIILPGTESVRLVVLASGGVLFARV